MDAYGYLAFFLILFVFFIYIVWFGYSVKVENQKEQGDKVTINPYDQIPLSRRLIDKKNSKVGIFDLGNHILICLLYTSPSPRDKRQSRMPSSA